MRKSKSSIEMIRLLLDYGTLTLSELARLSGYSRSWAWKSVRRLASDGVVTIEKRGGTLIVRPSSEAYKHLLRVGILRATEYPYILPFIKKLRNIFANVELVVYDEAFQLAFDIALGKVHLGMAPAVSHLLTHRISGGLSYIIAGGSGGGAGIIEGPSGEGHITTMASSMEFCAELEGLPFPRKYARSGDEILGSVESGNAKYGVLWQPYLTIAKRRGLKTRECDLPFCCVLGANRALLDKADAIRKLFAESIREVRRKLSDPLLAESYSRIIGFDKHLVRESLNSYVFYEEPPRELLRQYWNTLREVAFPERALREAVL
ncbi:MAG: hypothetical protein F7C33_00845 [Desulfurococcales archaeon]|nr:hypothetical protein [Desulfurococcales archaeon]